MIVLVPVLRSLLNRYLAFKRFAHDGLVAEDHIIETTSILGWYLNTQQFVDAVHIPTRQNAHEGRDDSLVRAQQGKPQAVQTIQEALNLDKGRHRGLRFQARVLSPQPVIAPFKI